MFKHSKVSLLLPTFDEAGSIRQVIEAHEPKQGYGHAIRSGFTEAIDDLIIVSERGGTFVPSDIQKFLVNSDDVAIVYGSRTVNNFIWQSANMGGFFKWGDWFTAKFIEVLFNTNSLSDVGCTFRLIHRDALEVLEPQFKTRANLFGVEMMLLGYRFGIVSVQIPINYGQRMGKSSVTGDFFEAFKLGLRMIAIILVMRLRAQTTSLSQPRSPLSLAGQGMYRVCGRDRWVWS